MKLPPFRYGLVLVVLMMGVSALLVPAAGYNTFFRGAYADTVEVHFIDVGQGDAVFISTPTHKVLIDGGNRGDTVLNYLRSNGVNHLDLVIGTHPHADHIGGLIDVLQAVPVSEVIDPAVVHTTRTFEDYLTIIDKKNIPFSEGRVGMTRVFGDVTFKLLHPENPSENHLNDASIVVMMTYNAIRFLFLGDAEYRSEQEMLRRNHDLSSTVMKVGHHGSHTSTSPAFLHAVSPEVAVIMCGADNRYGHPHAETLENLEQAKVALFRTDIHGTVIVKTDGQQYTVHTDKSTSPGATPTVHDTPRLSGSININTASLQQLQEIIHIAEDRALEIIEKRPFNSLDELTTIRGIGNARLEAIKLEGKAYVE